jgi:ribosomal protein S18 acetylase RimI-like enzyme
MGTYTVAVTGIGRFSSATEGILFRNREPIGEFSYNYMEPGWIHLHYFKIDGRCRRRGYGRGCWTVLERRFRQAYHVKKITLFVKEDEQKPWIKKRAAGFWKAMGFVKNNKNNEEGDMVKLF